MCLVLWKEVGESVLTEVYNDYFRRHWSVFHEVSGGDDTSLFTHLDILPCIQ